MTDGLPPYDTSPDNLQQLCEILREGEKEYPELASGDNEGLEMGETLLDDTIEYGQALGFIIANNESIGVKRRGQEFGYGNLPDDREQGLFRDGIQEYSPYTDYLQVAASSVEEVNGVNAITRDGLTRELRLEFNFDVSDRILESIANTFLKSLDAAGLGLHKTGRHGYPTRLEVDDSFYTFVDTPSAEEEESESPESPANESEEKIPDYQSEIPTNNGNSDSSGGQPDSSDNRTNEPSSETEDTIKEVKLTNTEPNLAIEISISSADWDSEEVVSVIKALQSIEE